MVFYTKNPTSAGNLNNIEYKESYPTNLELVPPLWDSKYLCWDSLTTVWDATVSLEAEKEWWHSELDIEVGDLQLVSPYALNSPSKPVLNTNRGFTSNAGSGFTRNKNKGFSEQDTQLGDKDGSSWYTDN